MSHQPICRTNGHPGIDQGTLNLNRTNAPGTTGTDPSLLSLLRDGVEWSYDKTTLEFSKAKEVLGLLNDVYGGQVGSGYKPIAEAWDRRVTNMSNANVEFSRKHQVGANEAIDKLAAWFAGTDPMKKKLFDHYIHGQGQDYTLTLEEISLMKTHFDLFETSVYSKNLQSAIAVALTGHPMTVDTTVSGQNDALGNFTINVKGVVKPLLPVGLPAGAETSPYYAAKKAEKTSKPLMFQGMMDWVDCWDFDAEMAKSVEGKSGRPLKAEFSVDAVAALADGIPFNIYSVTVAVIQYSGHFPMYG